MHCNKTNRIIGLLCININLDVPVSRFLQALMPTTGEQNDEPIVNFKSSVEDLVSQTVEQTIEEVTADRLVSNHNKIVKLLFLLYEKGILILKMV